jgi:endonuclease YncB( thermonuclease family)
MLPKASGDLQPQLGEGFGVAQTISGKLPRRLDRHLLVIATVIAAALIFIAASALGNLGIQTVDTATGRAFPCTVLRVMDGDGPIICAEKDQQGRQVQVRLRGIEARDGDGGCRTQDCPEMNWEEGKAVLTRIAGARMNCMSYGPYRDRVDAFCSTPDGADVSCELVKMGAAVRWPEFDAEGRLLGCVPGRRR